MLHRERSHWTPICSAPVAGVSGTRVAIRQYQTRGQPKARSTFSSDPATLLRSSVVTGAEQQLARAIAKLRTVNTASVWNGARQRGNWSVRLTVDFFMKSRHLIGTPIPEH